MNYKDYLGVDRLPRNKKKYFLGRILNNSKLRRLLESVQIISADNGRDMAQILPFDFCPKCGCTWIVFTSNRAPYPERWDSGYCGRCGFHVIESDNSPYYHCLELKEYDYVI